VHEQVIPIENVNLITKFKQFTPKNDVKLPKTVAMQQTLVDVQNRLLAVTTPGNLHLTVTGTGVVPVAGACQAQAAQIPVPTCTDGTQNRGEGDVDCGGGVCPFCQAGDTCNVNIDCQGFLCVSGICQPSCGNLIQNQDETDVDCGGTILRRVPQWSDVPRQVGLPERELRRERVQSVTWLTRDDPTYLLEPGADEPGNA